MKKRNDFKSIDTYISQFNPETQMILNELRALIKESAPGAREKISYQMPAFDYYGTLVCFAAFKKHIGFYPTPSAIEAFFQEISSYEHSMASIHFSIKSPLPGDLIRKIVRFRVAENIRNEKLRNVPFEE